MDFNLSFYAKAGLLILAKFLGLVGIVLGFTNLRIIAGAFLLMDAILLFGIVIACVKDMREQNNNDAEVDDIIAKMQKDGTLEEKLHEAGYRVIPVR